METGVQFCCNLLNTSPAQLQTELMDLPDFVIIFSLYIYIKHMDYVFPPITTAIFLKYNKRKAIFLAYAITYGMSKS